MPIAAIFANKIGQFPLFLLCKEGRICRHIAAHKSHHYQQAGDGNLTPFEILDQEEKDTCQYQHEQNSIQSNLVSRSYHILDYEKAPCKCNDQPIKTTVM